MPALVVNGGGDRPKKCTFRTLEAPWPWSWPWIGQMAYRRACITHRPLSTYQISL